MYCNQRNRPAEVRASCKAEDSPDAKPQRPSLLGDLPSLNGNNNAASQPRRQSHKGDDDDEVTELLELDLSLPEKRRRRSSRKNFELDTAKASDSGSASGGGEDVPPQDAPRCKGGDGV